MRGAAGQPASDPDLAPDEAAPPASSLTAAFADSPELAVALPSYHQRPSAPTNLDAAPGAGHQRADWPRRCGGVPGDGSSATRQCSWIPAHLADEVADEAVEMTAFEDFVTGEVLKGPAHHQVSAHAAAVER
jgi:hypothetical protein